MPLEDASAANLAISISETYTGAHGTPDNWAVIGAAPASPNLTVGANSYGYFAADLSIEKQSGDDFYIVDSGGWGSVASRSGGKFQCSLSVFCPTATIDSGSSVQRWMSWVVAVGSTDTSINPWTNAGLQVLVPIATGSDAGSLTISAASSLGVAEPGGTALNNLFVTGLFMSGTDSFSLSAIYFLGIWQTHT